MAKRNLKPTEVAAHAIVLHLERSLMKVVNWQGATVDRGELLRSLTATLDSVAKHPAASADLASRLEAEYARPVRYCPRCTSRTDRLVNVPKVGFLCGNCAISEVKN